jgi:hypothetical protein
MSILEIYGKTNAAGTGLNPQTPDKYVKKANARNLANPADMMALAASGDPTARTMLKRQSKLTPLTSDLQPGAVPQSYISRAANSIATRNDRLTTRTSELNSGGFQNDIATYTDRTFLQQAIGVTRLTTSAAANLISAATRTQPVYTAGLGTTGGAPTPDGRYDITLGYGFVLYGNLTNGGYA